ncbi:MAG: bifunctional DNA primase/polymerase [Pseudonocardia sp.]
MTAPVRPAITANPTATMTAALLAAALDAAARGWHVFPLRPGTKRPALHGAAHCPATGACAGPDGHAGWEQRATRDPDRIRAAWTAGATSGRMFNIGIACGPSRLLVIDLDTARPDDHPPAEWTRLDPVGGTEVLAEIAAGAGHTIPATHTVATPSGGRHLYFTAPAGAGLRNTAGGGTGLGWKIDTRGRGGYVVAPGSITPSGAYHVLDDRAPAELPAWLLQRLRPTPPPAPPPAPVRTGTGRRGAYLAAAIEAETARVQHAAAGQRNACLYVASVALGQLVAGAALTEHNARAALLSACAGHVALGAYSPRQAAQTITSGLTAGARRPRRLDDPTSHRTGAAA